MGALIVSMGVDLFFGVKKAKENGEATTSMGFKKTCDKARKYFSPFMVAVCIDLIACIVLPFPDMGRILRVLRIYQRKGKGLAESGDTKARPHL